MAESNKDLKLITPFLDQSYIKNIVINEEHAMFNEKIDVINGHVQDDPNDTYTFIVHNPYDDINLRDLINIHNSELGNIVFGVYGSLKDRDIEDKIRLLKQFKSELKRNSFKEHSIKINESYYSFIRSDSSINRYLKMKNRH